MGSGEPTDRVVNPGCSNIANRRLIELNRSAVSSTPMPAIPSLFGTASGRQAFGDRT